MKYRKDVMTDAKGMRNAALYAILTAVMFYSAFETGARVMESKIKNHFNKLEKKVVQTIDTNEPNNFYNINNL